MIVSVVALRTEDVACRWVVEVADGDAHTLKILGDSYFGGSRGYDLSCARQAYSRAVTLDPRGDMALWHQFGRTDFLLGHFDDAIFKFKKQIDYFGEKLPNVHYMLGLTYGYKARETGDLYDWQMAEEHFARFIELVPESPWPRIDIAWVLFAQGRYDEMKQYIEPALSRDPLQPWLLNMYGLALLNTGDPASARPYFERALVSARALSVKAWGRAYPGNDPDWWPTGLAEMVRAIEQNVETAKTRE